MKTTSGNFWHHAADYEALVCTINLVIKANGSLVMGKGIALQFSDNYPILAGQWGSDLKEIYDKKEMPRVLAVHAYNQYIIGLPTKIHWQDKSTVILIEKSLKFMVEFVDNNNIRSVLLPKPGCSNGGLDWDTQVKNICESLLDDRFTVVV